MTDIINDWDKNKENRSNANYEFLRSLKLKENVDEVALRVHKEVFDEVNCLNCANCCKTTPAVVTQKDIKRIAKHLNISPKVFIRKYVIDDLTGDLVLSTVPCYFLNSSDNTCSIYEVRPASCAGYPFTDRANFSQRTYVHHQNTLVCPATFEIVKRMNKEIPKYDL